MLVLRRRVVMSRPSEVLLPPSDNGTLIVSVFFQASLLPAMTMEVRLQVLDCSRRSADALLTTDYCTAQRSRVR
jgi:hypothetical protein